MKRSLYSVYTFMAGAALSLSAGTLSAQEGTFPRTALIEEFTSLTCGPCKQVTPIINSAIANGQGKVLSIRYHVNLPLPYDHWYDANPSQINSRRDYYQFANPPEFEVDGKFVQEKEAITPEADDRRALTSPIKIDVTQTRAGDQFTVNVEVTADNNGLDGDDYKLRVALVEKYVEDESATSRPGSNGETEFWDIFRSMLPNAEGEAIKLNPGQKKTFTYNYTLGPGWQAQEMYAIAFVQNDFTSEPYTVVQAAASNLVASAVDDIAAAAAGYSLTAVTPNPARSEMVVEYSVGARQEVSIEVVDAVGRTVMSRSEGTREEGSYRAPIDVSALAPGSYTCVVRAGDYTPSRQLIIVR